MDPEISGYENIIIRGLFLGQTRKQMAAKVDEIAEFTELGEYLSMPLRTYSTGMRVRLAMGVVTSIDPEILLLDEGIGAVDADFLKKAQSRLQSSGRAVRNPGVRKPFQRVPGPAVQDRDVDRPRHHQDDRRDRGRGARLRGRGRRPACPRGARGAQERLVVGMTDMVCAVVVTHRRPDELAKSLDVLTTQTRMVDHLIVVDNDQR